jgi:hypothetical protein
MICVKGKARQKGTPEQTCSVACLLQENGDLNLKQTNTGFHPRDTYYGIGWSCSLPEGMDGATYLDILKDEVTKTAKFYYGGDQKRRLSA